MYYVLTVFEKCTSVQFYMCTKNKPTAITTLSRGNGVKYYGKVLKIHGKNVCKACVVFTVECQTVSCPSGVTSGDTTCSRSALEVLVG